MQQRRQPDFYLNLQLPVYIPDETEMDMIEEHLDGYIKKLVDAEHMTLEEGVAYTKFATETGAMLSFLLDEFVERYRRGKWQKEAADEDRKRASIVKPTDEDIEQLR